MTLLSMSIDGGPGPGTGTRGWILRAGLRLRDTLTRCIARSAQGRRDRIRDRGTVTWIEERSIFLGVTAALGAEYQGFWRISALSGAGRRGDDCMDPGMDGLIDDCGNISIQTKRDAGFITFRESQRTESQRTKELFSVSI